MAEPQKKAKSDIQSGIDRDQYVEEVLGGQPPIKTIDQIEKQNTPGTYKNAVMKSSN